MIADSLLDKIQKNFLASPPKADSVSETDNDTDNQEDLMRPNWQSLDISTFKDDTFFLADLNQFNRIFYFGLCMSLSIRANEFDLSSMKYLLPIGPNKSGRSAFQRSSFLKSLNKKQQVTTCLYFRWAAENCQPEEKHYWQELLAVSASER